MDDVTVKAFPWMNPNVMKYVGSEEGSIGVNSQTGCLGHRNVWKAYFGRKIRKGDVIGSVLDVLKKEVRFLLRSVASRRLKDCFPSHGFPIDPSKIYHASVTLKYAQTKIHASFSHPFSLWDMIMTDYGFSEIFSIPPPLPFRPLIPIFNKSLPLPLSSFSHHSTEDSLQLASERCNFNLENSLIISLPFETIIHIFSFLDVSDIPFTSSVSHSFYEVCSDHRLWNELIKRDFQFGLGTSTQLYFNTLVKEEGEGGAKLTDSNALEIIYRNPYEEDVLTASDLAKDRYRKRYHWYHGLYDVMPTLPSENAVTAMAYDAKLKKIFFSERENFFSFSFVSGDVSQGLMSTVGDIIHMKCLFGMLFIGTDHGFLHILDSNTGAQIARFSEQSIITFDVHADKQKDLTLILIGTKERVARLWKMEGLFSKLKYLKKDDDDDDDDNDDDGKLIAGGMSDSSDIDASQNDKHSSTNPFNPTIVWENTSLHKKRIVSVSFLPESNGKRLITASQEGLVLMWKLDESLGSEMHRMPSESGVSILMKEERGGILAHDDDDDGGDDMKDRSYGSPFEMNFGYHPYSDWIMVCSSPLAEMTCVSVSPEGEFAAAASSSGEVLIFDAIDGRKSTKASDCLPVTSFGSPSVGPDGARADAQGGAGVTRHASKYIMHIHYECGGKLVTTQDDNHVRYWNQTTGLAKWKHQTTGLASALFCHENFLAFGLLNGRVGLLDFDQVELSEKRWASFSKRKLFLQRLSANTIASSSSSSPSS
jgi:hypothetical protein